MNFAELCRKFGIKLAAGPHVARSASRRRSSRRGVKKRIFISTGLAHEDVDLRYDGETEKWDVVFGPLSIGTLQETPSGPSD